MYFGLSEEQEFFQDNVKKFLTDNASIDEIRKIASGEGQELQALELKEGPQQTQEKQDHTAKVKHFKHCN